MIEKLFAKYRTIGVVGNSNTSKTSLSLLELIKLKKKIPKIEIYVFGVSETLYETLINEGIKIIYNKEDILDLKIKNSVIYIDEIAMFFDPHTKNKKIDRLKKWINRLYHPENNNRLLCSTAESGYWNKLMNDLIKCWIVKEIDYDSLVLRTPLRRKIEGLETNSEYRLTLKNGEFFILNEELTKKMSFEYNSKVDSKKDNPDLFKSFLSEISDENKNEISDEKFNKNPFGLNVKTISEELNEEV